jgi:hypothetical protein
VDSGAARPDLISEQTHKTQCASLLEVLTEGVRAGEAEAKSGPNWSKLKEMLVDLSKSRARQGFSPSETARLVLSLKRPLFGHLRQTLGKDAAALGDAVWSTTTLLDDLALLTTRPTSRAGRRSSAARVRTCWSCPPPWSASGTGSWLSPSSAPWTATGLRW